MDSGYGAKERDGPTQTGMYGHAHLEIKSLMSNADQLQGLSQLTLVA